MEEPGHSINGLRSLSSLTSGRSQIPKVKHFPGHQPLIGLKNGTVPKSSWAQKLRPAHTLKKNTAYILPGIKAKSPPDFMKKCFLITFQPVLADIQASVWVK